MATLRQKQKDHRQTLINATMRCIAKGGLEAATVTNIMQCAGLSRGMLHLYFRNKDELLEATAEHFSREYYDKLQTFLEAAGPGPRERLLAMVEADLSEEILNLDSVVILMALRTAAHTNPRIRKYATTRDRALLDMFKTVYDDILDGGVRDPAISGDLANGTIALLEGMWSDYFLYPQTFNRAKARRIVLRMIGAQLPQQLID